MTRRYASHAKKANPCYQSGFEPTTKICICSFVGVLDNMTIKVRISFYWSRVGIF